MEPPAQLVYAVYMLYIYINNTKENVTLWPQELDWDASLSLMNYVSLKATVFALHFL
jgi:hypothetical protein